MKKKEFAIQMKKLTCWPEILSETKSFRAVCSTDTGTSTRPLLYICPIRKSKVVQAIFILSEPEDFQKRDTIAVVQNCLTQGLGYPWQNLMFPSTSVSCITSFTPATLTVESTFSYLPVFRKRARILELVATDNFPIGKPQPFGEVSC